MSKALTKSVLYFLISIALPLQPIGGITLLPGYIYKDIPGVDAHEAIIYKEKGLVIDIEYGLSGIWAESVETKDRAWYKEQIINGHKVKIVFIKPGIKTGWEPETPRNVELGNILLITIPFGNDPDYAANFKAEIVNPEEMTDMLLMVLTFDPSKLN